MCALRSAGTQEAGGAPPTFDVSVDDHVAVQVGHAFQDLPAVAPRHLFRQRSVRLQLVLDGALERRWPFRGIVFPDGSGARADSAHARHVLHEDGQRPLHGVPEAAVVLHDPLVTQVLQQLDFTFQRAHLLKRTDARLSTQAEAEAASAAGFADSQAPDSDLAGLWTLRVKLDLFDRQLPARVGVVAEVDASEGSLAQELSEPPVGGSARGCSHQRHTSSLEASSQAGRSANSIFYSQRLGGLMSMTDRVGAAAGVGAGSMSLPLRGLLEGPGTSSRSGVKTLLPLLVLGDCSVGLKLTGDRKPWTWVLRARGKVFLPAQRRTGVTQRSWTAAESGCRDKPSL